MMRRHLLRRGVAVATCSLLARRVACEATTSPAAPMPLPAASFKASTAQRSHDVGVSIKDLNLGEGDRADHGMWVAVHYTVRLLGDDTVLEDTRTSGYGDRDYGRPAQFSLGELQDESVLRALHLCVMGMHTGGRRRVRTTLGDADFGYREMPRVLDEHLLPRFFKGEWLMDIEVTLVAVRPERPSRWERARAFFETFGAR